MSSKVKATIWFGLTAVFAVFGIVWTWTAAPTIWPTIVSLVATVASAVLGITFVPPKPPEG